MQLIITTTTTTTTTTTIIIIIIIIREHSLHVTIKKNSFLPGSFLVRNEALVIIDFATVVTVVTAGDKATLIPIGPSLGWPAHTNATVRLKTWESQAHMHSGFSHPTLQS
jgi:hypothetical protein